MNTTLGVSFPKLRLFKSHRKRWLLDVELVVLSGWFLGFLRDTVLLEEQHHCTYLCAPEDKNIFKQFAHDAEVGGVIWFQGEAPAGDIPRQAQQMLKNLQA